MKSNAEYSSRSLHSSDA
jgi:hypothetical protein